MNASFSKLIFTALYFSLCSSTQLLAQLDTNSPWPMFRQNPQHTGQHNQNVVCTTNLFIKWIFNTRGPIQSSPAVGSDETIYFGDNGTAGIGTVFALSADGTERWHFEHTADPNRFDSSPSIDKNGIIYIGASSNWASFISISNNGHAASINSYDGNSSSAIGALNTVYYLNLSGKVNAYTNNIVQWDLLFGDNIFRSSPAVDRSNTLYFGGSGGVYAVTNAIFKWYFSTGSKVQSSPLVCPNGMIVFGSDNHNLYAVTNGNQKWSFTAGDGIISSPALCPDGTIVFGCMDGKLYGVSTNGIQQWLPVTLNGPVTSSPAVDSQNVVIIASGNTVYTVKNGQIKSSRCLAGNIDYSSPAIGNDGTVYIGCQAGKFYALSGIESPPVLSWSLSQGFENDGVSPNTNDNCSFVKFQVKYSDPDNDAPILAQVWIDINDNSQYESGEKYDMTSVSGSSFTSGKIYVFSRWINYTGDGKLNYTFRFRDNNFYAASNSCTSNLTFYILPSSTPIQKKSSSTGGFLQKILVASNDGNNSKSRIVADHENNIWTSWYKYLGQPIDYIQKFDSSGNPLIDPINVGCRNFARGKTPSALSIDNKNRAWISWQQDSYWPEYVYTEAFSPDGGVYFGVTSDPNNRNYWYDCNISRHDSAGNFWMAVNYIPDGSSLGTIYACKWNTNHSVALTGWSNVTSGMNADDTYFDLAIDKNDHVWCCFNSASDGSDNLIHLRQRDENNQPVTNIDINTAPYGNNCLWIKMAFDENDDLYICWVTDNTPYGHEIYFTKYSRSGIELIAPVRVTANTTYDDSPEIEAVGNSAYIIWENSGNIFFTAYNCTGNSPVLSVPPVNITGNGFANSGADITKDHGGNLWISWNGKLTASGRQDIFIRKYITDNYLISLSVTKINDQNYSSGLVVDNLESISGTYNGGLVPLNKGGFRYRYDSNLNGSLNDELWIPFTNESPVSNEWKTSHLPDLSGMTSGKDVNILFEVRISDTLYPATILNSGPFLVSLAGKNIVTLKEDLEVWNNYIDSPGKGYPRIYIRKKNPDDKISLTIFDITGRLVKKIIQSKKFAEFSQPLEWSLENESGTPVADGLYLAELRYGTQTARKKIFIAR